jgi:hypothetical protein
MTKRFLTALARAPQERVRRNKNKISPEFNQMCATLSPLKAAPAGNSSRAFLFPVTILTHAATSRVELRAEKLPGRAHL